MNLIWLRRMQLKRNTIGHWLPVTHEERSRVAGRAIFYNSRIIVKRAPLPCASSWSGGVFTAQSQCSVGESRIVKTVRST